MNARPLTQPDYAAIARAAFAAGTNGAIGDRTTNEARITGAGGGDTDGLDLDNVEHVRKDRLRRWQSPPHLTGTGKGRT